VGGQCSHECSEGDFGCLAFSEQVLVEVAQDGITTAAATRAAIQRVLRAVVRLPAFVRDCSALFGLLQKSIPNKIECQLMEKLSDFF